MRNLLYIFLIGAFSVTVYGSNSDSHGGKESKHAKSNSHGSEKDKHGEQAKTNSAKSGHGNKVHWSYDGHEGPERWGDLSADYAVCKEGQNQSPINIVAAADRDLDEISFHYSASPVKAVNNGRTIQMNYAPGSYIEIGPRKYQLLQFHFHTPSEHTLKGEPASMEVHFVHKSDDGHLAVVGVMLKEGSGNGYLADLWEIMPSKVNQEVIADGKMLSAENLLPESKAYFHYRGSLTTPPCSEGVNWFVMQEPIDISKSAIQKFYSLVGGNARPVQSLHARVPMSMNK